ncbi:MAG: hypothetical protein Q8J92_05855 [Parvibaculum sp.]|uniref:hypothetical protein n=1 Tax=Parvibaculum sp. TaxID=2024848 RepID=UPI002721769F|nr:hypothetical protein [Parvibaculum sp.]MDO8839448.1 hypothetical protein [Parvibaculum sp.]MDP2123889.1 hypothetical protein [Parvibaculum sp.]
MEEFCWKEEHAAFIETLAPGLRPLGSDDRITRCIRLLGEALSEHTEIAAMRRGGFVSLQEG